MSEHIEEEDQLEVYFWGNENGFFYAKEFSKEVRYGTKLTTKLIRQVDPIMERRFGAVMNGVKSFL